MWLPGENSYRAQFGRRLLACRGSGKLEVAPVHPRQCLPAAVATSALRRGRHATSAAAAVAGACPVGRERERNLAALFAAVATTAFVTAFTSTVSAVSTVTAVVAAAASVAAALAAATAPGHVELRDGMQRDDVRRPERLVAV